MMTIESLYKQRNQGLINDLKMYLDISIWLENPKKKDVKIESVPTKKNLIDPLTKPLSQ
jgi:hypothetical protein